MTINKQLTMTAISLSLLSLSLGAQAEIQWSGFSSLGAGMMMDSDDSYGNYEGTDINWRQGSKVGLQASADLQEGLTFTTQILAKGANDFDPEIKWLYMGYEINDELSLKLGRVRAPIYKYSDYLDVGYAYHWARPPVTTYSIDFDTVEGISATYNAPLGDIDSSVSLLFGRVDDEFISGGETLPIEINKIFVLSWDLAYEDFTTRVAYVGAYDLTVESDDLTTQAATLTSYGYTSADNLLIEGDDAYFASIALGYDNGDQFVIAEGTYQDSGDNIYGIMKTWYISSGFRMTTMTYHLTYANAISEKPDFLLDGVDSSDVYYGTLSDVVDARYGKTTSWTLGARYDFHPSAALKVEYTNIDDHGTDNAFGDGNLITASVDLVF